MNDSIIVPMFSNTGMSEVKYSTRGWRMKVSKCPSSQILGMSGVKYGELKRGQMTVSECLGSFSNSSAKCPSSQILGMLGVKYEEVERG